MSTTPIHNNTKKESRIVLPEGIAALVRAAAARDGISVQTYVTAAICRDLSALLVDRSSGLADAFDLGDDLRTIERVAWKLAGIPEMEPGHLAARLLRTQKGGRR